MCYIEVCGCDVPVLLELREEEEVEREVEIHGVENRCSRYSTVYAQFWLRWHYLSREKETSVSLRPAVSGADVVEGVEVDLGSAPREQLGLLQNSSQHFVVTLHLEVCTTPTVAAPFFPQGSHLDHYAEPGGVVLWRYGGLDGGGVVVVEEAPDGGGFPPEGLQGSQIVESPQVALLIDVLEAE